MSDDAPASPGPTGGSGPAPALGAPAPVSALPAAPRLLLLEPLREALEPVESLGPTQREVLVVPPQPLLDGEGIALQFESGERLALARGHEDAYLGILPRARLEDPFSVVRTPHDVPEAGFHGQSLPRRSAALVDDALWIFPVAWADRRPPPSRPTRAGLHQDLIIRGSQRVPGERVIRVHLPEAYTRDPGRRFPVVYVLDGQNAFDASTSYGGIEWCLDDVALRMELQGEPPCILVGVDNGLVRRMYEYSFCPKPRPAQPSTGGAPTSLDPVRPVDPDPARSANAPSSPEGPPVPAGVFVPEPTVNEADGGGAKQHLDFLLFEVMPLIRAKFRVESGPGSLVGSSMGGLFALYAAIAHPAAFKAVAAISPSVWWANQAILRLPPGEGPKPRVWIDVGSRESRTMVSQFHAACRRLRVLGWEEGRNLRPLHVKGAAHHESSWADRSPSILRYLLGIAGAHGPSNPGA